MVPYTTIHVEMIPREFIKFHPKRRLDFDPDDGETKHFIESIQKVGVLQPIEVMKISDTRYEIVYGRRRFAACKHIGMDYIPCKIGNWPENQIDLIILIENALRKPLSPAAQTRAIKGILEELCRQKGDDPAKSAGGVAGSKAASRATNGKFSEKDPEKEPDKEIGAPSAARRAADGEQTSEVLTKPKAETFADTVTKITGDKPRTTRNYTRLAKALTDEQINLLEGAEATRDDMLKIAAVEDPNVRNQVLEIFVYGNLDSVEEAIEEATKDHSSQPGTKEAPKENELNDAEWLMICCSDIRTRIQDTSDFDADALLYRHTAPARAEVKKLAKDHVSASKARKTYLSNTMRRVMHLLHPAQWLLCMECDGQNVDNPNCEGCYGSGYSYQWDRTK